MQLKYELIIEHRNGRKSKAYFASATGLGKKSRQLRKFTNITLKRGCTADRSLFRWHQANSKEKGKGSKASLYLLDPSGQRVSYWTFDAVPTKYHPAPLDAKGNDVAIEELELQGEGIQFSNLK